jgi:hypothetical protein
LCKCYLFGTRNYLAEDLVQKLQGLDISQEKSVIQNLKKKERAISHPVLCCSTFPYLFKLCIKEQPAGHMLTHFWYHHARMLNDVRSKYAEIPKSYFASSEAASTRSVRI